MWDVEAFGSTTEVAIRNDLAAQSCEGGAFGRRELLEGTLLQPRRSASSHNNTCDVCVVVDSTLAAPLRRSRFLRLMRRLVNSANMCLSTGKRCLDALGGVLCFLIQTPSVESAGALVRRTSVFPNDSVTRSHPSRVRVGPPPPHLAAIFSLHALAHSTVRNPTEVICCYDFWTCSADGGKEENPGVSPLTVHRCEQ